MSSNADLFTLQAKIGYIFINQNLLVKALTHASYDNVNNNQYLEYLGDSLLDFLVAEYLYFEYPDIREGKATKLRAQIVSRWPLAQLFGDFELIKYIKIFNINVSTLSVKTKSDFVEAILGAIYVDGGIEDARNFVVTFLCENSSLVEKADYKSELHEYCAKRNIKIEFINTSQGLQHKQHFYSTVVMDGVHMGRGQGSSKREAEQNACKSSLRTLGVRRN